MFSSDKWFGATPSFYNGVATQSLRTDHITAKNLSRTPSSEGNKRTFTFSTWFKRSHLDYTTVETVHQIFSAQVDGNDYFAIFFLDDAKLYVQDYHTSVGINLITSRLFRDTTNWYHLVVAVDTTQGTASNRVKIYVNGDQETSFGTETYPSQNYDTYMNDDVKHTLGSSFDNSSQAFGGYFAETNLVDGNAYDPSYFGETKNGVWIAKRYSGSYGTNGFRFEYKNTSVGSGSSSTIGADTSGNTHHFTSSGIVASDCNMPDSPENNFCTLDPNFRAVTANTLSEGNLKCVTSTSGRSFNAGTFLMTSGKWYWEFRPDANSGGMGVAKINGTLGANQSVTSTSTSTGSTDYYYGETNWVMYGDGIVHNATYVGGTGSGMGSPSYPQIWGIGIDMDASPPTISYYIDGSSVGSADLDTGYDYIPIVGDGSGGVSRTININFGQNPTFNGTETAGTNTDGNGNGLFHDAVPSNHLALCSANLPDTTISPNQSTQADDHFNTVLYTGDASSDRSLTGFGFQPDWVWQKTRSASHDHFAMDSSRGANAYLKISLTSTEASQTNFLKSFDSDGVTIGDAGVINGDGVTNVMWNWKANGGTTTSDTTGSLTVNRQTNSDAGFSIITGTTSNVQANDMTETFGHGLGGTPDFIILKPRSVSYAWSVWTSAISISDVQGLQLNSNTGLFTNSSYRTIQATSSVVQIGRQAVENNSTTFVCYAFKEVEGYSKFGSYTGNGSTDGAFVYTGFRPGWVMVKRTDSSNNWVINDSTRTPFNEITGSSSTLYADANGAESSYDTNVDFLSNGFKARTTGGHRNASGTYVYLAFGSTFKFSNAR